MYPTLKNIHVSIGSISKIIVPSLFSINIFLISLILSVLLENKMCWYNLLLILYSSLILFSEFFNQKYII